MAISEPDVLINCVFIKAKKWNYWHIQSAKFSAINLGQRCMTFLPLVSRYQLSWHIATWLARLHMCIFPIAPKCVIKSLLTKFHMGKWACIHSILVITNFKGLWHFIRYCRYSLLPFTIVAYIILHVWFFQDLVAIICLSFTMNKISSYTSLYPGFPYKRICYWQKHLKRN